MNENIRKLDELAKEVIDDDELMGEINRELIRRANDYTAKVGMFNHGLEEGEKRGEKKGIKEGEEKTQVAIAKNLIKMKLSTEQIIEATSLSKEEIEKKKKELETGS